MVKRRKENAEDFPEAFQGKWVVQIRKKVLRKSIPGLPQKIWRQFFDLCRSLAHWGPNLTKEERATWENFGALKNRENEFHCHLGRSGKTTYVAVWEVCDSGEIKFIEVTYADTHEKAPY